jgi:endonuclease/exonuclease/phosphatase family metal-dependent hydrolase
LRGRQPGRGDFLAASTHFDHRGDEARKESAKLLRRQLAEIRSAKKIAGGMIVMGDFNCTVKDAPYAALVENGGDGSAWIDAYHQQDVVRAGPDSTWNGFEKIVPGQRIDFVFCMGLIPLRHEILDARIGERFLSDHLPVLVVLK